MQIEKLIITKAKWALFTDAGGLPILGYYGGNSYGSATVGHTALPIGVNMILKEPLMLTGMSRGRSAAEFCFRSKTGLFATTSMSGTEDLIHAMARGECAVTYENWRLPVSNTRDDITEGYSGAVFDGYWTVAKQGTSVTLRGISEEDVRNAKPY